VIGRKPDVKLTPDQDVRFALPMRPAIAAVPSTARPKIDGRQRLVARETRRSRAHGDSAAMSASGGSRGAADGGIPAGATA
jgi:hypothetical protein